MRLKFLKKNLLLFITVLLLLLMAMIFFMQKTDQALIQKSPKIEKIQKIQEIKKEKIEIKEIKKETLKAVPIEKTPPKDPIVKKKIDILGEDEPFVYSKPPREIDKIMQEQKKLDDFAKKEHSSQKKEDTTLEYKIGLEEGAIDKLKSGETLNPEMVNGKIKFSKSF